MVELLLRKKRRSAAAKENGIDYFSIRRTGPVYGPCEAYLRHQRFHILRDGLLSGRPREEIAIEALPHAEWNMNIQRQQIFLWISSHLALRSVGKGRMTVNDGMTINSDAPFYSSFSVSCRFARIRMPFTSVSSCRGIRIYSRPSITRVVIMSFISSFTLMETLGD